MKTRLRGRGWTTGISPHLRNDLLDGVSIVNFQSLSSRDFEASRIEAKLFHDCCVEVCDIVTIFDGVEAKLVSGTVDHSSFNAASRHPD